mgnify:CR=1 FL=1
MIGKVLTNKLANKTFLSEMSLYLIATNNMTRDERKTSITPRRPTSRLIIDGINNKKPYLYPNGPDTSTNTKIIEAVNNVRLDILLPFISYLCVNSVFLRSNFVLLTHFDKPRTKRRTSEAQRYRTQSFETDYKV